MGKIKSIAASALLSSVLLTSVNAQDLAISIGAGSMDIAGTSESSTEFNIEFGNHIKDGGFVMGLGYMTADVGALTSFNWGYRYPINGSLQIGASIGVDGFTFDKSNTNSSDLGGFDYGIDAKYKFTDKSAIIAKYKSGTLSASGLIDYDLTVASIVYQYTF